MMLKKHILAREDGFTLIEMMIASAIFIAVIIITTNAFNLVLTQTKKVTKSEESNIEGVIGLEMFRHDLEQAGFGLFNEIENPPPRYLEAVDTRPATYNDSPSKIPRAIVAGNNISGDAGVLTGTDYLAIKATTVALSQVSQKWTYINGVGDSKTWGVNDFVANDFVIATRQSYKNNDLKRTLIYDLSNPTKFSLKYQSTASLYDNPFGPPSDAVQYYYYGIHTNTTTPPLAPFNRSDYYVKRNSDTPVNCAPGAGVLYKSTLNQVGGSTGGAMTDIPILDCVADMQVVLGWSTTDPAGPALDAYTNADVSTVSVAGAWTPSLTEPADIRKHLKLITVYILAQDGGKDKTFTNPAGNFYAGAGIPTTNVSSLDHTINLSTSNYQNYRWKLYRIVVKPKNLI
jgi:prepilin-type N-terminal cleavage/methylation domain-containing protein